MTPVAETSLEAYKAIKPTLTDKQHIVLCLLRCESALFQRNSLCNYQIAKALEWPVNCVTGRVKELREKGLVVDDGKRPGPPTNRLNVYYWKAVKAETLF